MIKVFHQPEHGNAFGTFGRGDNAAKHIADHFWEFHHVANVVTNQLAEAWTLTNHIDGVAPTESAWYENNKDKIHFFGSALYDMVGCRSSMVGDVFYDCQSETFYYVAGIGFEKIDVEALIRDVLVNGGDRRGGKVVAIKYKRTFSYASGEGMGLKEAKDWVEAYMASNGIGA